MFNLSSNNKKHKDMNDLKTQIETLKSLAKELMKIGNLAEYFNTLKKVNKIENQLQLVKV